MSDKHWLKKIWENYAAIFHIVGYIAMIIFIASGVWHDTAAHSRELEKDDSRLSRVEYQLAQVIQKVDDIATYLHVPRRDRTGY